MPPRRGRWRSNPGPGNESTWQAIALSGWSPGQLEVELDENAWVVSTLDKETFANREEHSLWKSVLGNISDELRFLADSPEDPSCN